MEDENPFTKSQTIDPEVRAYVYSLVNALGGTSGDEEGRYVLGDDALAVLRDLKRWLKLYDEKTNRLDVARCLAEAKIVTGDLLPILASWTEDGKHDKLRSRLALACLELLVPLTWPLEHGEKTVNHHRHTPYLQQAQVIYKAGVLTWDNTNVLRQAIRVALPSIALRREDRTPRDEGIIKLMLYFLRNIATIRQVPNLPSQGLENEVSRSATIDAFRDQDVFALLLTMCSNIGEDFNLQDVIILEILFNLVKGVDVEKLWMTEAQRKGRQVSDLKATLNEEDTLHRDAKKSEWSRHGRFGTMIWIKREGEKVSAVSGQDNLRSGRTALFNIDKSKKWSKPERRQKDLDHTNNDFDRTTHLTSTASEKLRNFAEEFLDSGFNPLFAHLRKAIEREADRLTDVNYRQFFYVVGWFLRAERVRRTKQKKEIRPSNLKTDFVADSYGLVAAVLNQETFIMINRYMQNSLDNKENQDLNACMRCFTQILLTVQEMAQSSLEEDQEIAENIQNRIFYEETTHDRIANLLRGYKDQGFGYLDSCTELSHVFLRMLERYSKENADLQIRSRRKARQKKKEAEKHQDAEDQEQGEGDASEREDIVDVVQVARERRFDFKRFAAKFTSQPSVNTFVALTTYFKELSNEQLKRAHRFFHRVAFKQECAILLYRVDIVALFYKMIQGPEGLPRKHPMYAEWSEFTKQLFRKMFKKLDERPELFIELLFSKINKTMYYLEHGHDKTTVTSTRVPADLEVKPAPGRDKKEQIGIVVAALLEDEKADLVDWVKNTLMRAFDERHAWEAELEARKAAVIDDTGASGEQFATNLPVELPSYITVRPIGTEIQAAIHKNARLRLLLRLVDFETLGDEDSIDPTWIVPGKLSSGQILQSKEAVEHYEKLPWEPQNPEDAPEDMLRRVRKNIPRPTEDGEEELVPRDAFIDDSEGDDQLDEEEFLFPDNIRTSKPRNLIEELKARRKERKRKRDTDDAGGDGEVDEELAAKRRQAREEAALERRRKIKSELYIRDSDDESDEERDRAFFAKEEETRQQQAERIKKQMAISSDLALAEKNASGSRKRVKKSTKAQALHSPRSISDLDVSMHEDHYIQSDTDSMPSSQTVRRDSSEAPNGDEDTPMSSPHVIHTERDIDGDVRPLKEVTQPRLHAALLTKLDASMDDIELSDDGEEEVMAAPAHRRTRAGFIFDSDDDE